MIILVFLPAHFLIAPWLASLCLTRVELKSLGRARIVIAALIFWPTYYLEASLFTRSLVELSERNLVSLLKLSTPGTIVLLLMLLWRTAHAKRIQTTQDLRQ